MANSRVCIGGREMKELESAFPYYHKQEGVYEQGTDIPVVFRGKGMSLKQYAAIHLKVPRSGDEDIDKMIRESVKKDFMEAAVMGIAAKVYNVGEYKPPHVWGDIADEARLTAEAMLAEWEKEARK
jgi:hypothetical protein